MNTKVLFVLSALAALPAWAQDTESAGPEEPVEQHSGPESEVAPETAPADEAAPPAEADAAPAAPAAGEAGTEAAALEAPPGELTPEEEAQIAPRRGEWAGQIQAGVLATDGNTQSRSGNGKVHAEYKRERWKNTADVSALYTSSELGRTAERYLVGDKVDYLIYEKNYLFVQGEWEKDLFGAVRVRTSQAFGIGRHFLTGPRHILDADIGVGARQTEAQITGEKNDEAIGRFTTRYEWKFTEKNSLSQNLKVESGSEDTFSESVTALKVAIIGNLSSALSYTARHHTEVPPGREHLDSETALNLVYDIGKK